MYPQTYNPYYVSPYQQRLNQLEQPMYQSPPQPLQAPQNALNLKGRVVGSVDEARAAQVDFDGSTSYFVCPGEGRIYAKSIGMDGLPIFVTYEKSASQSVKTEENTLKSDFDSRLVALEAKVKELSDGFNKPVTARE